MTPTGNHNGTAHSYFDNNKGFNSLLRICNPFFSLCQCYSEKGDSISPAALHSGVSNSNGSQVIQAYNTSNSISN